MRAYYNKLCKGSFRLIALYYRFVVSVNQNFSILGYNTVLKIFVPISSHQPPLHTCVAGVSSSSIHLYTEKKKKSWNLGSYFDGREGEGEGYKAGSLKKLPGVLGDAYPHEEWSPRKNLHFSRFVEIYSLNSALKCREGGGQPFPYAYVYVRRCQFSQLWYQ